MDARALAVATLFVATCPAVLSAARFETDNFIVTAPTEQFARQVAEAAEYFRHELAIEWLGEALPGNWSSKCPIKCKVGQIGAGGATTFTFNNGEVYGWHMSIQGTEERILDSVLPHEVSHMIFASHFRRPLPRWADEGAATLVEHESERLRQTKLLNQVIRTSKRIPLRQLLNIKEYPKDMQDVLTLYAEGYALADYLVQQKGDRGKQVYLDFLDDAHRHGWDTAFEKHYGTTVAAVEQEWTGWVMAGSPPLTPTGQALVAVADAPVEAGSSQTAADSSSMTLAQGRRAEEDASGAAPRTIVRGQSTDELAPLPSLDRQRRSLESSTSLEAPRPAAVVSVAQSEGQVPPGQHRMTAQPRQPAIVEPVESPRRREMLSSIAESRTASGGVAHEDPVGHPRPISFDAPSGVPGDTMSPAPIAASPSRPQAGATDGLGPDSSGVVTRSEHRDDGRSPSFRGFTRGRGGPPASARGLLSP